MRGRRTKGVVSRINRTREEEVNRFRPAARKPVATEVEKRRLQLQNQFKGGNILPEYATTKPIEGNVPLSLVLGDRAALVNAERRMAAAKRSKAQRARHKAAADKAAYESDFDNVVGAVGELRLALEAAMESRGGASRVGNIRAELTQRIREMERLDEIIQDMER